MSHDPSEILKICLFSAQEIFLIINVETVVLLNMFCGNLEILFSQESLINRKFIDQKNKKTAFIRDRYHL